MTPVWQCIGIVVWPWVLAGGKGDLHHRVTFFFNRKISSNWVGCFLIPLKISLNFLYSLCVCIHMYMLCAHQVFMLTGPRPAWLYTLFFVMKSITDLGYHPGTLLSPPSTGVTGAFCNSRLSHVCWPSNFGSLCLLNELSTHSAILPSLKISFYE